MSLWGPEYRIQGKYATMTRALCDREHNYIYFKTYVELMEIAPLVGLFFRNKVDETSIDTVRRDNDCRILLEQLEGKREQIYFVYRLVILGDRDEHDFNKKVDMAFKYINDDKSEEAKKAEILYRRYLYGGIEVLYNRLIGQEDLNEIKKNQAGPMEEMRNFESFIDAISGPDSSTVEKWREKIANT